MNEPGGEPQGAWWRAWTERPLAAAALGLALGLWLGRDLAWTFDATALLIAGLAGGLAAGLCLVRVRVPLLRLALALGLSGFSAGLARVQPLAGALRAPAEAPRTALRLQGRLRQDEGLRPGGRRQALVLDALRLQPLSGGPWETRDGALRVSVDPALAQGWLPGDRVELYGNLRPLTRPDNPGEFDERAYLLGRGIQGAFSARQGWPARRLESGAWWGPRRLALRARQALLRGLAAGLEGQSLALARGIVLRDKAGLSREDLSDYGRSGFAYLLAVAGSHFAVVLGLGLLALRLLTRHRRWLAAGGLLLGLAYALVTGFEAPVQRAFALFAVWLLARLLDLECDPLVSLAFGALAILLPQPGALWDVGFQLSFACAWAVLALGPALAAALPMGWPVRLRLLLGGLGAIQWVLLPLLAVHFHQVCWPGLPGSLISGACMAVVLALGLPLALLGAWLPGAAALLGWPLEHWLQGMDATVDALAHLPGSAFSCGLTSEWLALAFGGWVLAFLYYQGRWRRGALVVGVMLLGMGLLWPGLPWAHRHAGQTRMWMLDVGQGDSLLLEFGDGRTLLVDGGPALPDAGAWVVVPALRGLGVQSLTWVAASHADADHVGGLAWVLEQMPCGELLHNGQAVDAPSWQALRAVAARRGVPLRALRRASAPDLRDGPWTVLNPLRPRPSRRAPARRPDTNRASLVLRVQDWLLLTGDLPKPAEQRLLKLGLKSVQVLKVAHHGSSHSTSPAWAHALRPAHSLISCGPANRFGHPQAPALAALRGSRLWRTDLQGCVRLERWDDGRLVLSPWKAADAGALDRASVKTASPWKNLKKRQAQAWAECQAPDSGGQEEAPEDGQAS